MLGVCSHDIGTGVSAAENECATGTGVIDAAAAGEVQRLGGQCLQVLLSAQASWCEDQRLMGFENPSADFLAALELFGIKPDHLFQQEESVA